MWLCTFNIACYQVTGIYKCGNHLVFGKDLEQYQADVKYSLKILEENNNGTSDTSAEVSFVGPCQI